MSTRNSNILVTSGAGFIGSHLTERLVGQGASVTVVDSAPKSHAHHLNKVITKIKYIEGNLQDLVETSALPLASFDCIFHLAGSASVAKAVSHPAHDFTQNVSTTVALLEAVKHVDHKPRLIFLSSAAVYGNPACLPIPETAPLAPISPYGVAKMAAERYMAVYSQLYGVRATSLRLFSVYGPRQQQLVIYEMLHKMTSTPDHMEVIGDGNQARDFIHVSDVVDALLIAAAKAPGQGEVYNVSSGTSTTIRELMEIWMEVSGIRPRIHYTGHSRPGDPERWQADISAISSFGFKQKIPLREGLQDTLNWYNSSVKH